MPTKYRLFLLLILPLAMILTAVTSQGLGAPYTLEILNNEFVPYLNSVNLSGLNDDGVVAGITSSNVFAPAANGLFRPQRFLTTYAEHGPLQSWPIEATVAGISNDNVIAGTTREGQPFLFRDGVQRNIPLPQTEPNALIGINGAGVAYGTIGALEDGSLRTFVYDGTTLTTLPIPFQYPHPDGGQSMNSEGLIAVGSLHLDPNGALVSEGLFLYDIPNRTLAPIQFPRGWQRSPVDSFQVTNSGVYSELERITGDGRRYGVWNADGSFQKFLQVPTGLSNLKFNDLGQAVGMANDGQTPMIFDGNVWMSVEIKGLGGGLVRSIYDLNNRGEFVGGLQRGVYVARPASEDSIGQQAAAPVLNPENGHYYLVVQSGRITFDDALAAAAQTSHLGIPGHLATVTSPEEQDFLLKAFGSRGPNLWIGASDAAKNDEWKWVAGPEAGQIFWKGNYSGSPLGFDAWERDIPNSERFEPNNAASNGGPESFLELRFDLSRQRAIWNDLASPTSGYIVEYSPVPEPSSIHLMTNVKMAFSRRIVT